MSIKDYREKISGLFCEHDWKNIGIQDEYVDNLGNKVIVWKYKCRRCDKIKLVKKK